MAELKVLETVHEFFKALRESELVGEGELAELEGFVDAGRFGSPRDMARHLIEAELATPWQVKRVLVGVTNLRLGRYLLFDQLAEHEFGRVFRARHEALEREVALKVFHRSTLKGPEEMERLLEECRRIAQFDHRNLVHVLDVEEERGRVFLVMEYVAGENLSQLVESRGTVGLHQAVDILRQAAAGLAYLHNQDVAHGDVQPESILIDEIGHVRLAGIGVAGVLADRAAAKRRGFQAPEYASGAESASARSDVYALGAVGYFLLTGKTPEELAPATEVAGSEQHHRDFPPLRTLLPDAPGTLERTLKRMTAHVADDRYAEAQVLVHLFEDLLEEVRETLPTTLPVEEHQTTADDALSMAPGEGDDGDEEGAAGLERPMLLWIAAAAVGLIVLGAGVMWWRSGSESASVAQRDAASGPQRAVSNKEGERGASDDAEKDPAWESPFRPISADGSGEGDAHDTSKGGVETGGAAPSGSAGGAPKDGPAPSDKAGGGSAGDAEGGTPDKAAPADPKMPAREAKKPPVSEPPKEPGKTEPKPAPPKKPAKPRPPREPFAKLPKVVALPLPGDSTDPFVIGPIDVDQFALVIMRVEGSEQATRGSDRFVVENAQGGTELHRWDLFIVGGKGRTPIGLIDIDQGKLRFTWKPQAEQEKEAPSFINTVLNLTLGAKTHRIVLRKPITAEQVPIRLNRSSTSAKWKIPNVPNPAAVRCRIRGLAGGFPKEIAFDPGQEITLARKSVRVMVGGKEPEASPFILQFSLKASRTTITATVTPKLRIPPSTKLERFTAKRFRELTLAASNRQEQVVAEIERLKKQVTAVNSNRSLDAKTKKGQVSRIRQAMNLLEQDLEQTSALAETLDSLKQSFEQMADRGAVDVELFLLVGKTRVVLLSTAAAEGE